MHSNWDRVTEIGQMDAEIEHFFWPKEIKRIKFAVALREVLCVPAGVLCQSVGEIVDLIICRSRFILEAFILIPDHCQLLKFLDQILILSFKLLSLHVRFLKTLDFGFNR